ncbi:hypothetical protein BDZ89DRAFT_1179963 [Hymenopellis radicata]|nr:hypothetical protein BDZ89DRAFT_1179963 [Hymenopellis radicata]
MTAELETVPVGVGNPPVHASQADETTLMTEATTKANKPVRNMLSKLKVLEPGDAFYTLWNDNSREITGKHSRQVNAIILRCSAASCGDVWYSTWRSGRSSVLMTMFSEVEMCRVEVFCVKEPSRPDSPKEMLSRFQVRVSENGGSSLHSKDTEDES